MDPQCASNAAWSAAAVTAGRMIGWTAYVVYRPGANAAALGHAASLPPGGHVMIDVESWRDPQTGIPAISGDHSAEINALVAALSAAGYQGRVWAYGNQGDLGEIYPARGDLPVVVASYGDVKPAVPHMVGWQYTNGAIQSGTRPVQSSPFGLCDHNELYVDATPAPAAQPKAEDEMPFHFKYFDGHYIVCQGKIIAIVTVTAYVASLPDWGPVSKAQLDIFVHAYGPAVNN
jgi:hypothetical protein